MDCATDGLGRELNWNWSLPLRKGETGHVMEVDGKTYREVEDYGVVATLLNKFWIRLSKFAVVLWRLLIGQKIFMKSPQIWKCFLACFCLYPIPASLEASDLPGERKSRISGENPSLKAPLNKNIWETLEILADPEEERTAKVKILSSFEEELAVPLAKRSLWGGFLSVRNEIQDFLRARESGKADEGGEKNLVIAIKSSEFLFSQLETEVSGPANHCLSLMWAVCSPGDTITTARFSESSWKRLIGQYPGFLSDDWSGKDE